MLYEVGQYDGQEALIVPWPEALNVLGYASPGLGPGDDELVKLTLWTQGGVPEWLGNAEVIPHKEKGVIFQKPKPLTVPN
jgi:hypothetical protein